MSCRLAPGPEVGDVLRSMIPATTGACNPIHSGQCLRTSVLLALQTKKSIAIAHKCLIFTRQNSTHSTKTRPLAKAPAPAAAWLNGPRHPLMHMTRSGRWGLIDAADGKHPWTYEEGHPLCHFVRPLPSVLVSAFVRAHVAAVAGSGLNAASPGHGRLRHAPRSFSQPLSASSSNSLPNGSERNAATHWRRPATNACPKSCQLAKQS